MRKAFAFAGISTPGGVNYIQLTVEVQEPGLAFLIGKKWSIITPDLVTPVQALLEAWHTMSMQYSAVTIMLQQPCQAWICCLLCAVQTDRCLPALVAVHTLTASALQTAPTASHLLVLLIHTLSAIAGTRALDSAKQQFPGIPSRRQILKLEIEIKQSALRCLKEDIGKSKLSGLSTRILCLCSCTLPSSLLKLADLTPQVS